VNATRNVSGRGGVTLAEVILSLGLLAIILVCVIGLFQNLLASTTKSSDLTVATIVAQQRLNELVAQREQNLAAYGMDFPTSVVNQELYTHDSATATTFHHRATSELLYLDPAIGKTYFLEVLVYWFTADPNQVAKNRMGQGKMSVKMGRVVYVPNP